MSRDTEAFFLPVAGGRRFCVHHTPLGAARAAVLYVHPWAEEMNKSRRMAGMQARALADAGCAVLQLDLWGCGDSSGDFGDASWAGWLDDIAAAAQWLRQRHAAPLWLWGLRAGALLATQAGAQLDGPCSYLFWQPSLSGKPLLQQFLRLKAAAEMQHGDAKAALAAARAELAAGRALEVAGYRLPPALARGLEEAVLELPPRTLAAVWLEASTREPPELLPASAERIAALRARGHRLRAAAVAGPAFWQTQEIEDAPQLLPATLDAMLTLDEAVPA